MSTRLTVAILILLAPFTLWAQGIHFYSSLDNNNSPNLHLLQNDYLTSQELIHGCRHLLLDIDATGYFFDAEYATPMAKGYSVAGFRLSPTLSFGINERAQLRVGFDATSFAGLDSLYNLRPTFSLVYMPTKWLQLVAGTLFGGYRHQLSAPVYDPSRWIYHPQEEGLQIITTRPWKSDTWLDWHHYLTPYTPDQEQFTLGTRHSLSLFHMEDTIINDLSLMPDDYFLIRAFDIDFPIHFIADHRGGEVKTIDTNTVTTFNERIGLQFNYKRRNFQKNWTKISLDIPVYFYHLEDTKLDHGGKALYPTISYEFKHLDNNNRSGYSIQATAGFWHGNHYFSAHGLPAFWSINNYSSQHMPLSAANTAADIRNILTFTFSAEHEFKGLNLGLQVDTYYDIDLKKTDFLFGFYMRFRDRFILL